MSPYQFRTYGKYIWPQGPCRPVKTENAKEKDWISPLENYIFHDVLWLLLSLTNQEDEMNQEIVVHYEECSSEDVVEDDPILLPGVPS